MGQKRDILIIGVNFNTFSETIRYIESLAAFPRDSFSLVLVDNSTEPPPPGFTEQLGKYDFIDYLKPGSNLGYFGGAKSGLEHYLRAYQEYPAWVFVTNVDIAFTGDKAFTILKQFEGHRDLGAIAPAIISERWKSDYNPESLQRYTLSGMRFYKMIWSNIIFSNFYTLASYLKKILIRSAGSMAKTKAPVHPSGEKIYAPHGSCIIFHKNYFERGGDLGFVSFLFGEEIFVAETAAKLGLDILYIPEIRVLDFEHASTGHFISPSMNRHHKKAMEEILRNYYQ